MNDHPSRLPHPLNWPIPAGSTHDGIPLGNGLFGALLWGQDDRLRITINRADYWDHRGGVSFGPEATYAHLCKWLETGDEANLRRVFEGEGLGKPGDPPRPTRLPMGRVDLALAPGARLEAGRLNLADGSASLDVAAAAPATIEAHIPRGVPVLALRLSGYGAGCLRARCCPPDSPEVREYWQRYGLPPAEVHDGPREGTLVQILPQDPAMAVAWRLVPGQQGASELYIAAEYGPTAAEALRAARERLDWAASQGYTALADQEAAWWRRYWATTAWVDLPDARLQEAYQLGMYKLAGLSMPGTPAATLQGPWVEEYRIPPWSADYHFNINVQECYWPAYNGNQVCSLEPLFAMLRGWLPKLRENARLFLGIEDGLMLNHAVDDRCTGMGGFWTGAIDHGSTAWVAQLMWQYYLYTLDRDFLAEQAYPFMVGAMRVYEAMLEEQPDGSLCLPVSVSPEYGGSALWAWGANASFQLAIIHCLCRALVRAAAILECDADKVERWRSIDARLPLGSIIGEGDRRQLQLWDGQPLAESHRHHSHLAGLYPFDVFTPWQSEEDLHLLQHSLRTWTFKGMGAWSGWCVPWAAILQARMHNGERAALLLEEHQRVFTTPGRASTHDAVFAGLTVLDGRPDIMQIEATMGAAAAVLEMLLHTAGGVLYVFPAVPASWQAARFQDVRTEGAFLVSAERRAGRTAWVRIASTVDSHLRLAPPFAGAARLIRELGDTRQETTVAAELLEVDTHAGEMLYLLPVKG